jgi:hypothetical protein
VLFLLEDCKNCVDIENFDEPICVTTRNYTLIRELEILDEIYEIEEPIIVTFVPYLEKPDGTKAKGNYGLGQFVTRDSKKKEMHMIMLDSDLDLIEAATILIHEYAHILSQQNHDFKMYELWREYLRTAFVEKWEEDYNEKPNWDRVIIVGNREEVE